jgi:hypothetical protein
LTAPLVLELVEPSRPDRCARCRRRLVVVQCGRPRKFCSDACRWADRRKRDKVSRRSSSVDWYTPTWVLELADDVAFGTCSACGNSRSLICPECCGPNYRPFDLDPASDPRSPAWSWCATSWTKAHDGLLRDWRGRVWCNPPYGRGALSPWTLKARGEVLAGRAVVVLLVPLRPSTAWWRALVAPGDLEVKVVPLERRVAFGEPQPDGSLAFTGSARFDVALVILRPLGSVRPGGSERPLDTEKGTEADPDTAFQPLPAK